jgi:hypothetical protein
MFLNMKRDWQPVIEKKAGSLARFHNGMIHKAGIRAKKVKLPWFTVESETVWGLRDKVETLIKELIAEPFPKESLVVLALKRSVETTFKMSMPPEKTFRQVYSIDIALGMFENVHEETSTKDIQDILESLEQAYVGEDIWCNAQSSLDDSFNPNLKFGRKKRT